MIQMSELTAFLTPAVLTFLVITAGCFLGRVKLHGMSLDLAGVLICAVTAGWLIGLSPLGADAAYISSVTAGMKTLSSLGTAIFVPTVGISAGYSFGGLCRKNLLYFFFGGAMVLTGLLLVRGVWLIDREVSVSALLGILCGSLTSTPGMSAASEIPGIRAEEVALGYGSSYVFGVVFVVLFVQLLTRGEKKGTEKKAPARNREPVKARGFLEQIGLAVIGGSLAGQVKLPFSSASLGTSGGMLCVGAAIGFLIRTYFPSAVRSGQTAAVFRNLGLVFFFAGSGIPAGLRSGGTGHPRWLLYGIGFTLVPVLTGYVICRILGCTNAQTGAILAGGMTSTPAAGVLLDRNENFDLSAYTTVYVGALMTMVVGIRYFCSFYA